MLSEEISQITVWCVFNDDIKRTILRTTTKKIYNIDVLSDHLHHFHLRHQIHHFVIGMALWKYSSNIVGFSKFIVGIYVNRSTSDSILMGDILNSTSCHFDESKQTHMAATNSIAQLSVLQTHMATAVLRISDAFALHRLMIINYITIRVQSSTSARFKSKH